MDYNETPCEKGTTMFIAVLIALTVLITSNLITRAYFLAKIEKLEIVHRDKINLDFRRGYDGGWEAAMRYRDQKSSYDKISKPSN